MWTLQYYNKAMRDWYDMARGKTEHEMRDLLQQWVNDEYYSRDIESFSEEYYPDEKLYIFTIDNETFGIWEEEI